MRGRNWLVATVLFVAVLAAAIGFGKSKNSAGARAPTVRFGVSAGQPPIAAMLDETNGWVAQAGSERIAVYAGSQSSRPANGLVFIMRTLGGRTTARSIVLHGSGSVTLLRPPRFASESDALGGTLHFITANGGVGSVNLVNDHAALHA
jgi:hypothetical protein